MDVEDDVVASPRVFFFNEVRGMEEEEGGGGTLPFYRPCQGLEGGMFISSVRLHPDIRMQYHISLAYCF